MQRKRAAFYELVEGAEEVLRWRTTRLGLRSGVTGTPRIVRSEILASHSDEGLVTVFPDLVNSADVGMVQGGSSTSLPAKAFERLWVFGYILRQELQSDKATEFGVLGLVHHTHPAAPELLDDAVVRNGLADQFEGNSNPRE